MKQIDSFHAKDLGVVIGTQNNSNIGGVLLYKPLTPEIPNINMTNDEIYDCISQKAPFIRFPYESVAQVLINNESIWENRNVWDRIFHGVKIQNIAYAGRGDLTMHVFRSVIDPKDFLELVVHKPLSLELLDNQVYSFPRYLINS